MYPPNKKARGLKPGFLIERDVFGITVLPK